MWPRGTYLQAPKRPSSWYCKHASSQQWYTAQGTPPSCSCKTHGLVSSGYSQGYQPLGTEHSHRYQLRGTTHSEGTQLHGTDHSLGYRQHGISQSDLVWMRYLQSVRKNTMLLHMQRKISQRTRYNLVNMVKTETSPPQECRVWCTHTKSAAQSTLHSLGKSSSEVTRSDRCEHTSYALHMKQNPTFHTQSTSTHVLTVAIPTSCEPSAEARYSYMLRGLRQRRSVIIFIFSE